MRLHLASLAAAIALGAASANAATIYEHSFGGDAADPLDGVGVESGTGAGTPWVAAEAWRANGEALVGNGEFDTANAILPFTPSPGAVYTLSVELTTTATTLNFLAFGFMDSPTATTPIGHDITGPWMFKRGQDTALGDEVQASHDRLAGLEPIGLFPGATQMSIVLDTQLPQWTAEFFVNGGSVHGPVDVAPTITHVGISRYVPPITGQAADFSLTVVPEPSSLLLFGAGMVGCVLFGRRTLA